jgi:hypothetical protein
MKSSTEGGTISAGQNLLLIGPEDLSVSLPCDWGYRRQDPYAVTLTLDTGADKPVVWTLSRDMLAAALHSPEGLGDVRAWPVSVPAGAGEAVGFDGQILVIELGPPDGCARFEAAAAQIAAFLDRSYAMVPDGQETGYLNVDAELAELLNRA